MDATSICPGLKYIFEIAAAMIPITIISMTQRYLENHEILRFSCEAGRTTGGSETTASSSGSDSSFLPFSRLAIN